MTIRGTLADGTPIEVVAFDGGTIVLRSPKPFAPGAPFAAALDLPGEAVPVQVKAHGSKRHDDGRFEVRGRTIALTRAARERLLEAIRPSE